MRGVALSILTLIASCAPDYGHSAFLCKLPDHGCPAGQSCIDGRCRRSEPTREGGVVCGSAPCTATQQCCVDQDNPATCLAAGEVCLGTSALCDGVEDCQLGDRCCADGHTVFCDESCEHYACLQDDDCPSTAQHCCGADATTSGECSRPGCDVAVMSGPGPRLP